VNKDKQNEPTPSTEHYSPKPSERPFRESNHEVASNTVKRDSNTVQSVMPPPTKPGKK
jgi:hypothetical protein